MSNNMKKQARKYLETSDNPREALSTLTRFFLKGSGYDLDDTTSDILQNLIRVASLNLFSESRRKKESQMCGREVLNGVKRFLFSSESYDLPEDVYNAVQTLYLWLNKAFRTAIVEAAKFAHYRDEKPVSEVDDDINKDVPNKQTFRAYKQFATHYNPNDPKTKDSKGLLYPLYIGADKGIRVGKWYKCGEGELAIKVDDNGEPVLDKDGKPSIKVKTSNGKLGGTLSYRPGWHLGSAPVTRHIGVPKDTKGNSLMSGKEYDYMRPECVWAEVEYSAQRDYTDDTPKCLVKSGPNKGQIDRRKACFDDSDKFTNGFYHYQTNNNANSDEDWLIANAIKVIRVLSDEEVEQIASKHGLKAQLRDIEKTGGAFIADFKQFKEAYRLNRKEQLRETSWTKKPVFLVEDTPQNVLATENWAKGFAYNMYLENKEDMLDVFLKYEFDIKKCVHANSGDFIDIFDSLEDYIRYQLEDSEVKEALINSGLISEEYESDDIDITSTTEKEPTVKLQFYYPRKIPSQDIILDSSPYLTGFECTDVSINDNTIILTYNVDSYTFVDKYENDPSILYARGFDNLKRNYL